MRKERKIEKLLTEIKAEKIFDVPLTFIIAQTRNTVLDQILYIWVLFTTSISHQLPSYGTVQDRIRGKVYIEGRATFRGRGPKYRYENSLLLPHLSFFVYSALQLHITSIHFIPCSRLSQLMAGYQSHCMLGFIFIATCWVRSGSRSRIVQLFLLILVWSDFHIAWFSGKKATTTAFQVKVKQNFTFRPSVQLTWMLHIHACVRIN